MRKVHEQPTFASRAHDIQIMMPNVPSISVRVALREETNHIVIYNGIRNNDRSITIAISSETSKNATTIVAVSSLKRGDKVKDQAQDTEDKDKDYRRGEG